MLENEIVRHEYRAIRLLGAGGMGEVWLATDSGFRGHVAVKFLAAPFAADEEFRRRFHREARLQATLHHRNVVQVLAADFTSDRPFIVTEYCPNGDLHGAAGSSLSAVVALLWQVMEGLAFAHDKGVIHRDIKPSNILVDDAGIAKLADFGLARLVDRDSPTLTVSGLGLGTPRYMAPEQFTDAKNVDARVDVYSLGVVIGEMIAGVFPPFTRDKHVDRNVMARFKEIDRDTAWTVVEVIRTATAFDRDKRFPSIQYLMKAWSDLLPEPKPLPDVEGPAWKKALRELTASDFETLTRIMTGELDGASYQGDNSEREREGPDDYDRLMVLVRAGLAVGSEQHGDTSSGEPIGGIWAVTPTEAGRAVSDALSSVRSNWSELQQFFAGMTAA